VFNVTQDFLQPEPCNFQVSTKLPEGFDFPDWRAVQKFAFYANLVFPTVNCPSCFLWRNAMVVGCPWAGGASGVRTGVGEDCENHADGGRRLKRVGVVVVIGSPPCLVVLALP